MLEDLTNPQKYSEPVDLKEDTDKSQLLNDLKMMLKIRLVEYKISDMIESGKIICPCHLSIGQEAVAVGIAKNLRNTDRAFGNHRSHAHYLAMGGCEKKLFAEVLGKVTGCSKGMGGSMHIYSEEHGFKGSVPIVAGTIPIAVGAGLAALMENKKENYDIGVCFFGDGACEEGVLHESLNFASCFNIPVIFVCENNLFSSHMHISQRQPDYFVSRFAKAHNINTKTVDGNNIVDTNNAMKYLTENARMNRKPGFLEAITYRWKGHVGPSDNIDVGLKRSEEINIWKKNRNPIKKFKEALKAKNYLTDSSYEDMYNDLKIKIDKSWKIAESDSCPDNKQLEDCVYAN